MGDSNILGNTEDSNILNNNMGDSNILGNTEDNITEDNNLGYNNVYNFQSNNVNLNLDSNNLSDTSLFNKSIKNCSPVINVLYKTNNYNI